MTGWVRVGEGGTTGELGCGGELPFLSDGGAEAEQEGEGREGRRRGEERREMRGMMRLGEGPRAERWEGFSEKLRGIF